MTVTRLARADDAAELADQLRANRDYLAPWEPIREDGFFTCDAQRTLLEQALDAYARGITVPLIITDDGGRLIGRINIAGITRGPLQSANIGYWVSQSHRGRGFASAAVADAIGVAFKELELHRLQAETLLHNTASQRVLARNGFKPFGVAPSYLKIAGRWQDHIMYQLLNESV
jgi:[ribosomal protein S5]-alanine N-acetyltransferase